MSNIIERNKAHAGLKKKPKKKAVDIAFGRTIYKVSLTITFQDDAASQWYWKECAYG